MKIAVIGATGRTGRPLIEELTRRGHQLVVLARDPARLGELPEATRVVRGDSRDRHALDQLVAGTDAVISALGPSGKDRTLHRDTAAALVEAMKTHGVRRFVGVSGAGISVPGDRKSRRDRVVSALIRTLGGSMVADKAEEYRTWAASDLEWTLVRPPRLQDGPAIGRVEHHAYSSPRSTAIRRADLAAFLVDAVEQGLHPRLAPLVAGGSAS